MRDGDGLLSGMREFASELVSNRAERLRQRHLDPNDYDRLHAIGYHRACVPVEHGGSWEGTRRSVRTLAEMHRLLAMGDPSLSLSLSMHPGVLAFWREADPHDEPEFADWEAQKRFVFDTAINGIWWGTITSEPGTGANIANTRMAARRDAAADGGWRVTGEKHFGSGSSVASYMITTALPEGESEPSWFFMAIEGVPWDGSAGLTLRGEWDGHGMAATDSHGFAFKDFPATRFAWPGHWRQVMEHPGGSHTMVMVGVIMGVIDAAMDHVRAQLHGRSGSPGTLSAFEKTEWVAAQREAWLLEQAYEGGLRALERHGRARLDTGMAKANGALLAESIMTRLCRIAGGAAYSRRSPLGHWFEDVRALGYLRPPWSIALDSLHAVCWEADGLAGRLD
jgi:alkylation response protein AidB-like acyl-CoA dehydrogenase